MKKLCSGIAVLLLLAWMSPTRASGQAEPLKTLFLKGDYQACAREGEQLLSARNSETDEVCYLTGLSCLKIGDYAGARRAFEVLVRDFRKSAFIDEAKVGIGDSWYLKGDWAKAVDRYEDFLRTRYSSKLKPGVYYRLYLCNVKRGKQENARQYQDKLKSEFPSSLEAVMHKDIFPVEGAVVEQKISAAPAADDAVKSGRTFYAVQVGAFSRKSNADRVCQKLTAGGYTAYVEPAPSRSAGMIFKVKIGKFDSYSDAKRVERKLAAQGYSTKIDPQ
jgi:tetratricopeptide (TPR) repeat protein